MKERKTPADFAREITGAEIEGYRFTGYDITELMRSYADHAVEIARKKGYEKGRTESKTDKYAEGYRHGYVDGKKEEKEQAEITLGAEQKYQYRTGFNEGYEKGKKEERERHAKLVQFAKSFQGTQIPIVEMEAKKSLESAGYLGKEEK